MEKNTILAVLLIVGIYVAFFMIPGFSPGRTQNAPAPSEVAQQPQVPMLDYTQPQQTPPVETPESRPAATTLDAELGPESERRETIETELFTAVLTNAGGDLVSLKLKKHKDGDDFVEMVLSGDREAHAFTVALGGLNAQPLTSFFHVERESRYTVKFYRDFIVPNVGMPDLPGRFTLTKRYEFKESEYMFELTVSLDGGYSVPGFNFGGNAYTLSFGPQIGPHFEKLDNRYDYRHYITYVNGKRKTEKANESSIISSNPKWAAISGKYFACIGIPLLPQYGINFSERGESGVPSTSRLSIIRPPVNSPRTDDTYRFYLGPKSQDVLNTYNTGNNSFGFADMQLVEVANTKGILSPLESILKALLLFFHRLVHNYGIAIILLTLTVKLIFFPLTEKSSEATLRMQALSPKIKELQEKHKGNPQKMNQEMAELYKKEGYNPLSGCLPMLLQLPIFFAMYNLFNSHFDLRGAMFIPGWIPDLSVPEAIWNFPAGVRLPLLGWTALRLLPFIYVASQLLYGKVTQTPDQQTNTQMKMMLYVMPIVFFFILYDVPSGLLIYWIFSNLLTMVQQWMINKYILPRKRAAKAANAQTNAPQKKNRRR